VAQFDRLLEELRALKPEASAYLCGAEPERWALAKFRSRRYGHDTSNIAESFNKLICTDRELPIVELLDALWHWVMAQRAERSLLAVEAIAKGQWPPLITGLVEEGRNWARCNGLQMSSPTEARVVQPDGRIYLVDLTARTCSCRRYQENGVPCGHAMTLIFQQGSQLTPFLPTELSAVC